MNKNKMEEPYVPDLGYNYPKEPDGRFVKTKIVYNIEIDENYLFYNKSFKFKFLRFWTYFVILTLMRWISFFCFGLKIKGRKNLKKFKKELKNGAMSISNHVHRWDFPFIANALRYRTMYFPVWKENINSPDKTLIQLTGGIPIPEDIHTIKYFNSAFDEIHKKKKWIHAYPESTRFDYFQPIRPFKKGVFSMAHRYNLPIIPMAYSYRKPRFPYTITNALRTIMKKQKLPMITLSVGEPLFFDSNLDRKEAVIKMRKQCHEAVVRLAGITDNPYPAEGD